MWKSFMTTALKRTPVQAIPPGPPPPLGVTPVVVAAQATPQPPVQPPAN
jgi:hypothetical protein